MASRYNNKNASKKVKNTSRPPWMSWSGSTASKIIRFIEDYVVIPKGYGAGQPMQLAQFQKDGIEELFADGVRTGEFSMARGNGKSSLIAALALAHLCIEPFAPQVPLVATKLRQIEAATYDVAIRMAKAHPEIRDRIKVYSAIGNKRLMTEWNGGEMFPMSSDVEGLQGLDPSLGLIDEYGFVSTNSWDALKMASGKRPTSLVLGLGTTGDTDSAHYHLHLLNEQGTDLPGHVRINHAAPADCDYTDPRMWAMANPALAEGFLGIDALEGDLASSSEGQFRRFRLNQWVELADASWLGPDAEGLWGRNTDTSYRFDDSKPSFGGVDVAMYSDSSAVIRVQERPDGRWHARAQIFWPNGDVTPFDEIKQAIRSIPLLSGCAYDNRFFADSAQQLTREGILMIDLPQTPQRMVPAYTRFHRMIVDGTLTHDGAPDYAAQVTGAVAAPAGNGFTLKKSKSKRKIDAAAATAMALTFAAEPTDMTPELIPAESLRF